MLIVNQRAVFCRKQRAFMPRKSYAKRDIIQLVQFYHVLIFRNGAFNQAKIHRRAPPLAPYAKAVGGTCGVLRKIQLPIDAAVFISENVCRRNRSLRIYQCLSGFNYPWGNITH